MAKSSKNDSLVFLQAAVSAFFVLVGLVAIVNYNSDLSRFGRSVVRTFGGSNDPVSLIIAILAVVAGLILLGGLVFRIESRVMYAAGLGAFVFWSLRILYVFFLNDAFKPDLLIWLAQLSPDAIVLAALWLIARKYS